ncbi:Uncharacterized protein AXF42_Ash019051 [Apostasia shenzhenica]|uniref:Uncharacterized protein n=1 Tax=Apostasia shenzhenica TaxID=1088818 RepID=A0A2I0BB98_9ASPA|nr:Uncharacterized protein AXF42_Ash019051 [Apostasia shenzhenica]
MMQSLPRTLLLLLLALPFSPFLSSGSPSAYEMLEKFNFPKGILPQGVKSYRLEQDGGFEVVLYGECEFHVDGGYLLKYRRRITGKAKSGQLKELDGVSVKVILVWFGISEVDRSGSNLLFYVGPLSASFPLSNFEECPNCRCGSGCAAAGAADPAALVSDV